MALALAAGLLAGCVHYPMVSDIGGVRIQPANGRVVRAGDGATFFADINSTGKFEDVLTHVETPIAHKAQLVDADGRPLERLTIAGTTLVHLAPAGPRVVLTELTRELQPGEVVIVTLVFQKAGAIGVIAPVQ